MINKELYDKTFGRNSKDNIIDYIGKFDKCELNIQVFECEYVSKIELKYKGIKFEEILLFYLRNSIRTSGNMEKILNGEYEYTEGEIQEQLSIFLSFISYTCTEEVYYIYRDKYKIKE